MRYTVSTVGTGGSVQETNGEFKLQSGTTANGLAVLSTNQRGQYYAGSMGQAGIGVRIPTLPTGTAFAEWGYTDGNNGFLFGVDATGKYVAYVTGSGVTTKTYQPAWNIDTLDGAGNSGMTIDLAEGHVSQIDFTWYGYGDIEYSYYISNATTFKIEKVPFHRTKIDGSASIADPNQPLTFRVGNGASNTTNLAFMAFAACDLVFRQESCVRARAYQIWSEHPGCDSELSDWLQAETEILNTVLNVVVWVETANARDSRIDSSNRVADVRYSPDGPDITDQNGVVVRLHDMMLNPSSYVGGCEVPGTEFTFFLNTLPGTYWLVRMHKVPNMSVSECRAAAEADMKTRRKEHAQNIIDIAFAKNEDDAAWKVSATDSTFRKRTSRLQKNGLPSCQKEGTATRTPPAQPNYEKVCSVRVQTL